MPAASECASFTDRRDERLHHPGGSGECPGWTSLRCEKSECHKATVQEIQQRVCNWIISFQSWGAAAPGVDNTCFLSVGSWYKEQACAVVWDVGFTVTNTPLVVILLVQLVAETESTTLAKVKGF